MPADQRSPNSTTRQTKGSVVCTTVTNTLVQIAISTLPARADGAAAGSGQQGRSSSEGRGAVVQDAEGSKQQPSKERVRGHIAGVDEAHSPACKPRAVVRSDLGSPRCSGPMCRAWAFDRCIVEVCARDADGLIGRAGRCWSRGFSARPAGDLGLEGLCALRATAVESVNSQPRFLCQRGKAMSLCRQDDGASSKRAPAPPPADSSSAA